MSLALNHLRSSSRRQVYPPDTDGQISVTIRPQGALSLWSPQRHRRSSSSQSFSLSEHMVTLLSCRLIMGFLNRTTLYHSRTPALMKISRPKI
ncbi:hypothetical protein TNCT_36021 [Trichonephila clavata]|uniref:Uncharacterized protein n=1 Tax=Trichonephila clavata TaxID=2740835 RepID=A0A8X6L7Z9_TRICU|nr:hypothetical protein TNCT_36021 [Trichonephila clavata]